MLRITLVSQTAEVTVLELEGWIADEEVAVLTGEGLQQLALSRQLVLDLSGVRFIDETGLALLQGWSGQRLCLRRPSGYIRTVLGAAGLEVDEG